MPQLALAAAYWLHMLATVVWIGSLAALSVIVLPAAHKSLNAQAYSLFLSQIRGRLQPVGWFSLAILVVTGMFQMSANPSYEGFLAIKNTWAVAILLKHLTVGIMVLVSGYMTWGILPALQRVAFLRSAGEDIDEVRLLRLERNESRLLVINLCLSIAVIALTAWARASG